jgi:hypothetical protein
LFVAETDAARGALLPDEESWMLSAPKQAPRGTLKLVAINGRRLDLPRRETAPEVVMTVSFRGLTESEQRAALSGFPGGRRFRLAGSSN